MRCCEGCGRETAHGPYCIRCVGRPAQLSEAGTRRARPVPTEPFGLEERTTDELTAAEVYHGETWRDDL